MRSCCIRMSAYCSHIRLSLTVCRILTTPLMALKKRGFNVDRILNQQREERLRLQAETARDREKAANEARAAEDAKASSSIPWPGSSPKGKGDREDAQSILSEGSQNTAVGSDTGTGGKSKSLSLIDRLKRRSSKSGSMDGLPPMPGALPGMSSQGGGGLGGFGGSRSGSGGGVSGGGNTSTKRVSKLLSPHSHHGSAWRLDNSANRSRCDPLDCAKSPGCFKARNEHTNSR